MHNRMRANTVQAPAAEDLPRPVFDSAKPRHDPMEAPVAAPSSPSSASSITTASPRTGASFEFADPVEAPEDLCCPVLRSLFRDPVVNGVGNTYERVALKQFWAKT